MKTFTNKSNAARAAKKANGGTLTGLALLGSEGAWYYAAPVSAPATTGKARVPVTVKREPGITTMVFDPSTLGNKNITEVGVAPKAKPVPMRRAAITDTRKAAKKAAPAKKAAKKAAPAKKVAVQYDPKSGPTQGRITGYHIDADRDEKHGVKRRSAGTIGGRLWAIFDKLSAKAGGPQKLEIGVVKESKDVAGFNANKVVIEFYYWRRYHGVRGRGKKQKVA